MKQERSAIRFQGGDVFGDGEDYVSFTAREKLSDVLNELGNRTGAISLADIMFGRSYDACDGSECYCESRFVSRDHKPRLVGSRVVLNTLTGESMDVNTPLLENINDFIGRLYRFKHPRSEERFEIVWSMDAVPQV